MHIPEKYIKYLPSKKFVIITSIVFVLIIIIYLIFFMSSSGENFSITGDKKSVSLVVENPTLTDLIERDTDGDGVQDWEEALWGTDKTKKITFNDMPDATYIENKKKELKIEDSVNQSKLTETDKFAREFFISYTALKASGQVDADTINNFSNSIGQNIANSDLVDIYTDKDIKINTTDTASSKEKYYTDVQGLFKKYQASGIGDELDIVSNNINSESTDSINQYSKLTTISNAYKAFAQKTSELSVPKSLAIYHLKILNGANNTGVSVANLSKISTDPIVGISGLSQYQKYSDELIKTVSDLETFLAI